MAAFRNPQVEKRAKSGLLAPGLLIAAAVALALVVGLVIPDEPSANEATSVGPAGPVVVELFTSQSCYSCPPAEAYLGELAGREDLIALEFHVDYWDDLVYGSAGQWKDIFSDPAYTRRQQIYARRIPGGRVYTPQMVVSGQEEAVGSRRRDVQKRIARVRAAGEAPIALSLAGSAGEALRLDLSGEIERPLELWLVSFERSHVTRVQAGENKGKTLANHHVVTAMQPIARWDGGPLSLNVETAALGANQGCAVIAQEENQGPIRAARYCP